MCYDLDGATLKSTTNIGQFTDITERDFVGDFVYAVNVGGKDTKTIKDASFKEHSTNAVTISGGSASSPGGEPTLIRSSIGTKAWGNDFSTILKTNMNHANTLQVELKNVAPYHKYKLQLFFMEREDTAR